MVQSILSVVGPISQSPGSLKLLIQSLLSQKPWLHDPLVLEIPWRDAHEKEITDIINAKEKFAFGILTHDGIITPHPPVQRAMGMVIQTLERLGHKTVPWDPPSHKRGLDICVRVPL